jgi:peptidoglycan/xylan/chitin deacetylase (PgdA/CDA1 family)
LIENHSYDHSKVLPDISTTTLEEDIQEAETAIFSDTGLKPKLFRPPYGNISAQMFGRLNHDGYKTVMWNADAADWDHKNSPTSLIETAIIHQAAPNGIIILHDGRDTKINYPRDNMINALTHIIEKLKSDGYTFVTVDKIVGTPAYFDEK